MNIEGLKETLDNEVNGSVCVGTVSSPQESRSVAHVTSVDCNLVDNEKSIKKVASSYGMIVTSISSSECELMSD